MIDNELIIEMEALRAYLGIDSFGKPDTDGRYSVTISGIKIIIKPTGDYNYEVTINGQTQENALEYSGDLILSAINS